MDAVQSLLLVSEIQFDQAGRKSINEDCRVAEERKSSILIPQDDSHKYRLSFFLMKN